MSKVDILHTTILPEFFHKNEVHYKEFKNFPYVKNNKGEPITPINMYLTSFLNTNLSESSIKRVAFSLKKLIDYCENNQLKLNNFFEDDLVNFSKFLQNEKDEKGLARNSTTVNNILHQVIKFFEFFGSTFLNEDDYAKKMLNVVSFSVTKNGREKTIVKHKSMSLNAEKVTRNPISVESIDFIYQNLDKLYVSKFAQERTKVLLKLLEHTGARIGEIALIRIKDIVNALESEKGLLQLTTFKRRRESTRVVPVDKMILNQINTFMKIYRSKIIKKTTKDKDLGYLFLNEQTGLKINSSSLSNDFNRLKRELGISTELCAHMFRHRYITNIFINLIKQYDLEHKDGFRNALLDVNTLKAHVKQLTGHKDVNSLDTYLHLAKSELANMPEILRKLENQRNEDTKEAQERYLFNELKSGAISSEEYVSKIELLKNS